MNKNKQVIISHCKQETFTNPPAPSNISPGPFDSRRCLKFRVGDIHLRSCVSRDICQRGLDVIKSNCFCYFIQNRRFYIERKLTVCNSFHHFHVCWSVVTRGCVFSAVLSYLCQNTTTRPDLRYQSLKSWKIDIIDLIKQFSLSIFTYFRYQSIQITWSLPIFIHSLLRAMSRFLVLRRWRSIVLKIY